MNKLPKLLILLIFLGLGFIGEKTATVSAQESSISGETTSLDGTLYTNELFDLSISKPEGWYAQSTQELLQMQQLGASLISGDNQNLQATLKESLKTSLPLFSFYQYPLGSPTPSNANIAGVAENISLYPGIKQGCDYLYHAKQIIAQSQFRIEFADECLTKNVNNSEFGYFNASINLGQVEIKQRYYACVKDTHAISIVQTYTTPEESQKVDRVLDTLSLKCN